MISVSGLRPESPWLDSPVVDTLQPTLRWESFPDPQRLSPDAGNRLAGIDNVTYELRIADLESPFDVVVSESGLREPSYTLTRPLVPETVYLWTVRARFELDNKPRISAWSNVVTTVPDHAANALRAAGQLANAPNAFSYRFETPASKVETPIFADVEEHVGTTDVGEVIGRGVPDANLEEFALAKEHAEVEQFVPEDSARAEQIGYRIAIFPFKSDSKCIGQSRPSHEKFADELGALIAGNNALQLGYSYYNNATDKQRIAKPEQLWAGEKPNLARVSALGETLRVDAVVMYWRAGGFPGYCTDRQPPFEIDVYVIDVKQQKRYWLNGREKNLSVMTNQTLLRFLADAKPKAAGF